MRTSLNRLIVALAALSLLAVSLPAAAQDDDGFTNADLEGRYGIEFTARYTGNTSTDSLQADFRGVGAFMMDGEGNITDGYRIFMRPKLREDRRGSIREQI